MDKNSAAFRRTQSLRYPKGSAQCNHLSNALPSSSVGGFATGTMSRKTIRHSTFRSRSSRNRLSTESQYTLNKLSFGQKAALLTSWRALRTHVNSLMRKILTELELVSPKVKDIFYKAALVDCFSLFGSNATLDEHVKFFDDLLNNMDNEQETTSMIKQIGQCHAILNQTCGFNADIWEQLGEIAMEKICTSDPKTREAGRAWRTLIAFVTDTLRCSFDVEAKAFSRRTSTDNTENNAETEPEQQLEERRDNEMIRKLQELRLNYTSTVPLN